MIKSCKLRFCLFTLVATVNVPASMAAQTANEPVYIYLFSHTEDHINLPLSEERFSRTLPMIEQLHTDFPQYRPSASFQFYGADSETLSGSTVSSMLDAVANGYAFLGYHGAHEPTYSNNPIANIDYANATWEEIQDAMLLQLNAHRHLYTGALTGVGDGALARTNRVFGPMTTISGLESFDQARAHAIDATNPEQLLFGYSAHAPNPPPNYMGGIQSFANLLSPTNKHAPQAYMARHHLRLSGTDGTANFDCRCMDGVAHLQSKLALLDRSHPNILMVGIASKSIYALSSPTGYAYDNPTAPELPSNLINPRVEIEFNYQRTQAVLNWLVNTYFPANPGSRFVSAEDLNLAYSSKNDSLVSDLELYGFSKDLVAKWDTNVTPASPPPYLTNDGQYLSLCDMAQCLIGMLGNFGPYLPTEIYLGRAIAPIAGSAPSAAPISVTKAELLATAALLDPQINSTTWAKTPSYILPEQIAIGTSIVNTAEMLFLLAQLYIDLYEGNTTSVFFAPASAMVNQSVLDAQDDVSSLTSKWPNLDWDLKPANLSGFPARLSFTGAPLAGGTLDIHLTDDPGSIGMLAVSTQTTSQIIPGLGELLVDLSVGRVLPTKVVLGDECFATWTVSIPPTFHGTVYAQAKTTRNGNKELSDLLTVTVF